MNPRFVKIAAAILLTGAMTAACGHKNEGPLLKGHIEGAPEKTQIYLSYSPYGEHANVYEKIELDSLGNFEFNPEMPDDVDFMEVGVMAGDATYGAYVKKGDTSEFSLVITNPEEFGTMTFTGDNADVNEAVNVAAQAYDFMRYFSIEPEDGMTAEEYAALLESENARVEKALEGIKDAKTREYFTKLYGLKYLGQKMSNTSSRLYKEKNYQGLAEMMENEEYARMFNLIDINDPMTALANLTGTWVAAKEPYNYNWENPSADSLIMNIKFVAENIKEPFNRRAAIHSVPYFFLEKSKPSKAEAQKVMDAYAEYAAEYPEFIEQYQKVVDAIVELNEGTPMPYYPVLKDTEGNDVKLQDLMGKVTYIDIWATWCGPCCREIPYLDKVVERFKGNDKIQFISISVDDDLDAWKAKLAKDNPAWAQYVLTGDEKKQFMSSMGIQGIPRFILLDAEGNFIANDATRPSDDDIDRVLNDAISK